MITHDQPTAAGTCYGLRVGGGLGSEAVRFLPTEGCVPESRWAFDAVGGWDGVLGTDRETSVWSVPALILLVGLGVALVTDIIINLLPRAVR